MIIPEKKYSQMPTQAGAKEVEAAQETFKKEHLGKSKAKESKKRPTITGLEKTKAARPERVKENSGTRADKERTEITAREHYKQVLAEVTYDMFEKSIKNDLISTSIGHLEKAFTMNLPEYHKMKTEFLDYINQQLEKENLALEYKVELQVLKTNVETDNFDFMTGSKKVIESKGISKEEQAKFREKMKTSEIELIPDIFDRRIAEEDLVGAYRQLAKAAENIKKIGKYKYEEMKNLFLLTCDTQLTMPDDELDKKARKNLKKAREDIENDKFE